MARARSEACGARICVMVATASTQAAFLEVEAVEEAHAMVEKA